MLSEVQLWLLCTGVSTTILLTHSMVGRSWIADEKRIWYDPFIETDRTLSYPQGTFGLWTAHRIDQRSRTDHQVTSLDNQLDLSSRRKIDNVRVCFVAALIFTVCSTIGVFFLFSPSSINERSSSSLVQRLRHTGRKLSFPYVIALMAAGGVCAIAASIVMSSTFLQGNRTSTGLVECVISGSLLLLTAIGGVALMILSPNDLDAKMVL